MSSENFMKLIYGKDNHKQDLTKSEVYFRRECRLGTMDRMVPDGMTFYWFYLYFVYSHHEALDDPIRDFA